MQQTSGTNSIPQYEDNFQAFCEYKAAMIMLMLTEGKHERGVAILEALKTEYSMTHYEAVKAQVAKLLG